MEQLRIDVLEWEEVTKDLANDWFHETAAADGKSGDSQRLLCCRLGAQESASLSLTD